MDTIVYLKNLLRDKQVASFMPTSAVAVEQVCRNLDFSKRNVVVEYGPGTGVFTQHLLARLTADSVLILIERNEAFIDILNQAFRDSRLFVFHDSAENIQDILQQCDEPAADYIISGIPFSFLPPALRDAVVRNSHRGLRAGGEFLAYQTFFQIDRFLKKHLDRYFTKVTTEFCIFNAPPLRIFRAIK